MVEPVWDVCPSSNKLIQPNKLNWHLLYLQFSCLRSSGAGWWGQISWRRLRRNETILMKSVLNKGNSQRRKWSCRGPLMRSRLSAWRGRGAEAIAWNLRLDELADDFKRCRFKMIKKRFHSGHLSCNPDVDHQGEWAIQQLTTGGAIKKLWLHFGKACHPFFKHKINGWSHYVVQNTSLNEKPHKVICLISSRIIDYIALLVCSWGMRQLIN